MLVTHMKKILISLLGLFFFICAYAEDRYHIKILNEISYQQAQNHVKPWEISKYTYTNPQGVSTTKYFIFAPSIKHGSSITLKKAEKPPYPWQVSIDGKAYYANFDDERVLRVGDKGVLKYDGDRLYFYKEN